ncbi:MAG: LAGLIDADG family homing endonuclease, partial [Acidimicrobiales bacterium]
NRTRVKVVKNKCVAAGTTVFDPGTGLACRIEDIAGSPAGRSVVAADKAGHLHARAVLQGFDQGEAQVVGLGLRDGITLWATPDHRVLTDLGWRQAGDLSVGDRVARPRRCGSFGTEEPVSPEQARMLGYLIGDGYVDGKTPGHLAPTKHVPEAFFQDGVLAEVVANLLFGYFETDGWVSREQTGSLRVGFTTTSEQLGHQVHWLLLRWGIGSSVRRYIPSARRPSIVGGRRVQGKLPVWEIRISGMDNVERFADAIPMWGPRGQKLIHELDGSGRRRHRGSQRVYLPASQTEPVLAYLRGLGLRPSDVASMVGDAAGDPRGGFRQVLGHSRLRRDRVGRLADLLDSTFLRELLDEDVWYDRITVVHPPEWRDVYDLEVDEHHTFVADDIVVSNCSPPFRQAEFDIMYGKGISREGSMLDVAADLGIVKKSGAWYTYEGEQLGQGRENAKAFLAENLELMIEVSEKVRQQVGIGDAPRADAADVPLGGDPRDDEPISLD